MTISGLADVERICGGIVLGGESTALKPGRSTKMTVSGLTFDFNIEDKCFKTESCLQVYLPWFKLAGQQFKTW